LGRFAGAKNSTGSSNVFLGNSAGYWETGSDKLYIENSDVGSSSALIYGDFNTNELRINGNVGINDNGYSGYGLVIDVPSTQTPDYTLYIYGYAYATGSFIDGSDVRWKKNIVPYRNALSKLLKISGVTYNWKSDEFPEKKFTDDLQIGLIAQDVENYIPELVKTDNKGYKGINYSRLSVILIEAVKEQQIMIEELKNITQIQSAENNDLRNEIENLKSNIDELRTLINSNINKE